jgi:hypothetical protein
MAFRLVPIENAKTAADAEAYITHDTGGAVIPIVGKTEAVEGGWKVPCYSTDGRGEAPQAAGRLLFRVIAISKCGRGARIQDEFGQQVDVQRTLPAWGAHLNFADIPPTVTLEKGQTISGVSDGQNFLRDVVVEHGDVSGPDGLKERREFDGARCEGPGWTLGIATGEGFTKRTYPREPVE